MSLDGFSRSIKLRARNVPREVDKVVRKVALVLDQTLVLATPVDTGRARSNWLVSIGQPRTDEINPYSELEQGTDPSKAGERANAQAAINQGQEQIANRDPGETIHVTNNVEYIGDLNDGTSAQAPAGFVQMAVQTAVAVVDDVEIDTGGRT